MNHQEIKANMTQGTCSVSPIYDVVTDDAPNRCYCGHNSITVNQENSLAITHAINNTYGRNINPESVPDMLNALQSTLELLKHEGYIDTSKLIEDVINKATL